MSSNIPALRGVGDHPAADPAEAVADPAARPVRRSFTADYRARVVAEYEAAPHSSKAAVLRREGLYQSQIREWRFARDAVTGGPQRRAERTVGQGPAGRTIPAGCVRRTSAWPASWPSRRRWWRSWENCKGSWRASPRARARPRRRRRDERHLRRATRCGAQRRAGVSADRSSAGQPLPPRPGTAARPTASADGAGQRAAADGRRACGGVEADQHAGVRGSVDRPGISVVRGLGPRRPRRSRCFRSGARMAQADVR